MKNIFVMLILLSISVFATTGEDVYKAKCASCHMMKMVMKDPAMVAPAMPMVSMRLKNMTDSREEFITFVKDYIQNPSQEKGHCSPMAYKRFRTMPPIGKEMSEQERDLIAVWLHDSFQAKWNKSNEAKTCDNENKKKNMKCGAGKCGSKTKQAPKKCGAVKIQTH